MQHLAGGPDPLERIRYLRRTTEELVVPPSYKTFPGHLDWRRPDLYGPPTVQRAQ